MATQRNGATDIVRTYLNAFMMQDRITAEELLSKDFSFTSPRDDHIDRTEYFRRCWPNRNRIRALHVQQIFAQGGDVLLRYELEPTDGGRFRNTEFIRVEDGQIREVEVYFGPEDRPGS